MTCPHCRSHWVIVSALQNLGEKLLSSLGRHAYRCKSCSSRFFVFSTRRRRGALVEDRARRIAGHAMTARVLQHT